MLGLVFQVKFFYYMLIVMCILHEMSCMHVQFVEYKTVIDCNYTMEITTVYSEMENVSILEVSLA